MTKKYETLKEDMLEYYSQNPEERDQFILRLVNNYLIDNDAQFLLLALQYIPVELDIREKDRIDQFLEDNKEILSQFED